MEHLILLVQLIFFINYAIKWCGNKLAKSNKALESKNVAKNEKRGIFQEKQHKSRKQDKTGKTGKYENQESSEKKESQKKRKKKESQRKAKQGKYVQSWVTYSHRSPSHVAFSIGQH